MRCYFIILATIFYILNSAEGRNLHKSDENNKINDESEPKHVRNQQERHSRHRRQSYYTNYPDNNFVRNIELNDYLTDMSYFVRDISISLRHLTNSYQYNPFYYGKKDCTCDCDESIRKLLAVVEDLAKRAKYTPPQPPSPQIIYVPYIVRDKTNGDPEKNMTFGNRIGPIDDINTIWIDPPREIEKEEDSDSRPVSFKPLLQKTSTVAPPPQEQILTTTSSPLTKPGKCEGAILSCCGHDDVEKCFTSYNCLKTYQTGKACDSQVINMVLEKFSKMYGPSKAMK